MPPRQKKGKGAASGPKGKLIIKKKQLPRILLKEPTHVSDSESELEPEQVEPAVSSQTPAVLSQTVSTRDTTESIPDQVEEEDAEDVAVFEEENVASQDNPDDLPNIARTKRRRRDPLTLSDATEDDVIEWLKQNPCLYDKTLKEYRNVAKKAKLWADKEVELKIEPNRLAIWVESKRTQYGKLTLKKPSGGPAIRLTQRDEWIIERFAFMKVHISRHTSRHVQSVSTKFLYIFYY